MLVIPDLLYVKLISSSNPWHLAPTISRVNSAVCPVCAARVVGRCLVVQVFRWNSYLKWVSFIYVKMLWLFTWIEIGHLVAKPTNMVNFHSSHISCHRSSIRLSQECGSLLQIRPPKFTHFNVIILQNSRLFLDSLAHHQGLQLYKTIARIYCPLQYLAVWWIRCTESSL
jgi:hypothetical protein